MTKTTINPRKGQTHSAILEAFNVFHANHSGHFFHLHCKEWDDGCETEPVYTLTYADDEQGMKQMKTNLMNVDGKRMLDSLTKYVNPFVHHRHYYASQRWQDESGHWHETIYAFHSRKDRNGWAAEERWRSTCDSKFALRYAPALSDLPPGLALNTVHK